jgi:hypothetical protein
MPFDGTQQLSDTHPEIERRLIEGLRNLTVAQKFRMIFESQELVDSLILAEIKKAQPNATEWECRLRLASRRLPPELLKKAFDWDVAEKGY